MKFFSIRLLSALLLAGSIAPTMQASRYEDGEYGECCQTSCYECGCNPLYCGAFDLQFQAGIMPTDWTHRRDVALIQCTGLPAVDPINELFELPKFSRLFQLPWLVGGQIGYEASDNIRFYLDFNYAQAKGKHDVVLTARDTVNPEVLGFEIGKYKLFDFHIGARYYFDRWCDRLSLFVGAKAGLVVHHKINSGITLNDVAIFPSPDDVNGCVAGVPGTVGENILFFHNTRASGGLNIGLDYCFCGNWSLVFTWDAVFNCGPSSNGNIVLDAVNVGANNLIIGRLGTEIRFPITGAVRYTF